MIRAAAILIGAAGLLLAGGQQLAARKPANAELTRETYRERCLLCHKVPPDGISPEITAGFAPHSGPRARDVMPNTTCWRRCEKCWPEPAKKR